MWQMSWVPVDQLGSGMILTNKFGLFCASTGEPWEGVKQGVTESVLDFGKALSDIGRRTD